MANTVVSLENASMTTMQPENLLDRFEGDASAPPTESAAGTDAGLGKLSRMLQGLSELYHEDQYEEEFDMAAFLKKTGSKRKSKRARSTDEDSE